MQVITFTSATSEALVYIRKQADLIILDNIMPGLSGIDLLRALRQQPNASSAPVLMLTAAQNPNLRWSALDEGATLFRTKPINPAEVRLTVERLLSSHGARTPPRKASTRLQRKA